MGVGLVSLDGNNGTDARITIPAWGASYADVTLDGEYTIAGKTTLVIADLTVSCTVLSGGPAAGRSYYRVVAGAGGWGQELPKKSYANDAGVKLLAVLSDAATECGETLDTSTIDSSVTLGAFFVRPKDLACRLLEQLSPNAWYVGEDGVTRLGARPSTTLSSSFTVTSQVDLARATVTIASDTIAAILPGVTVSGITAVDVEHEISKAELRSKIWGQLGSGASRRLAAFRAMLDQLDPDRKFRGLYEYRIVTQSGERLNLQCIRTSLGMPDIQRVMVRPGVMGCKGTPKLGGRVVVGFANADPTFPIVVSFEDAEGSGFMPTSVTMDASGNVAIGPSATGVALGGGTLPVARQGDQVTCFLPPTLPVTGTLSGSPFAGTITIPGPISGSISGPCSSVVTAK